MLASLSRPISSLTDRIRNICSQWSWSEISGGLGDLGTLLPFLVALAKEGYISIIPALFWAGLFNITSAIHWNLPMPVQPMKAIATVALTTNFLNSNSIICAGILTAGTVMLLGITRSIDLLHKITPMAVVYGIQVGLGIRMITHAFRLASSTGHWFAFDSRFTALVAAVFTLNFRHNRHLPVALIVFAIGVLIAIGILCSRGGGGEWPHDGAAPLSWKLSNLSAADWQEGFIHGAIPQIPLTTLNSVIAVSKLAHDLYPQKRRDITRPGVASAVGVMNVIGCAFGAMPMCHGAGGLAAQHAFGARGGLSITFLGICKMMLALAFGGRAVLDLLNAFPDSVLGALLGVSGLELAVSGVNRMCENNMRKREPHETSLRTDCLICIATAGGAVATGSTAIGCISGLLMAIAESRWMKHFVSSFGNNSRPEEGGEQKDALSADSTLGGLEMKARKSSDGGASLSGDAPNLGAHRADDLEIAEEKNQNEIGSALGAVEENKVEEQKAVDSIVENDEREIGAGMLPIEDLPEAETA